MFGSTTLASLATLVLASCASYEQFRRVTEEFDFHYQIYDSSYDKTWLAVISVMKKFEISSRSQESGTIKTRWMDNTKSYNFVHILGLNRNIRAAQFQLQINVAKGFQNGREVARVTLYKRQLLERDVLQGFKEVVSDGILEKIILYRIGRLLEIEKRIDEIQKKKEEEQIKSLES